MFHLAREPNRVFIRVVLKTRTLYGQGHEQEGPDILGIDTPEARNGLSAARNGAN